MRGAIYSRVSTEMQDYSKQTNELRDYASKNDIEVVYVFEEKESGFNNDRPEFEKLRKLTKQDIDIVLVWEISRLSRRSIYLQQQIEDFTNKGICIYSYKENLHTLNRDGTKNDQANLVIAITATIAEQEAITLKARTLSGKRHKILKEGHSYTPLAPYGYDYNKLTKRLSINIEEAEIVKRIFQLSIDGYSAYRIPIILNAEGILSKKKNKWSQNSIRAILDNPVYMGKAEYHIKNEKPKDGKTYRKPIESVSIDVPAIITADIYQQSKEQTKARTNRSNSTGTKYLPLLRGLIVCPECGRRYAFSNSCQYYRCNNIHIDGSLCNSKIISTKLETIIWNIVKTFFYKELTAGKAQEKIEALQAEIESYKQQILLLDGKQAELTAKANIIVDTAIEIKSQFPNMPTLYINKMKEIEVINKEVGKYQQEIDRLEKLIHSNESRIKNINKASEDSSIVDSITDEVEKYNLVHKAVDKIMIFGEGKTSIIVVTFSTGQTIYLGYFSKRNSKYYIIFQPSQDIYFNTQTAKGYINHIKEKPTINTDGTIYLGDLKGEDREYGIIDFINYLDIEENRQYYRIEKIL